MSGGSYNSSDTLNFTGTITDNEAIKQIAIVSTQEDFWSNTASFSYDTTVISSWDFQLNGGFSLVLPSTSGETQSVIYAIDTVGNQSSKSISYQVN